MNSKKTIQTIHDSVNLQKSLLYHKKFTKLIILFSLWKKGNIFSQQKSSPFTLTSDKKSTRTLRQPSGEAEGKTKPINLHSKVFAVYLEEWQKSTRTIRQPSVKWRVKQNPSIYTAKCSPFTLTSDKKSTRTIRQPSAKRRVKHKHHDFHGQIIAIYHIWLVSR